MKKEVLRSIYTIRHYSDLYSLLGSKWFIRGINENGDFCYVVLDTVMFYLSERLPLVDYQPTENGSGLKKLYFRGYSLVFSFVRRWCSQQGIFNTSIIQKIT